MKHSRRITTAALSGLLVLALGTLPSCLPHHLIMHRHMVKTHRAHKKVIHTAPRPRVRTVNVRVTAPVPVPR